MNLLLMCQLVSQRLNEGATGFTFYPKSEIVAAVNEALRFFVLLTLGLERTATWNVPNATAFFRMLQTFPDWIVPLRIATVTGAKVRPARLEDLSSLDSQWIASAGDPLRYAALGADFLALYRQPPGYSAGSVTAADNSVNIAGSGTAWTQSMAGGWIAIAGGTYNILSVTAPTALVLGTPFEGSPGSGLAYSVGVNLNVTYACAPVPLVSDADVPAIPAEYHPQLPDYAIYRLRQREGAQEFAKALPLLGEFLDAATRYAAYVRARNLGSRYDKVPFEIESFDRSKLLKLRPDVVPERKVPQVTS